MVWGQTPDLKNYQPWHNAARGKRTRTTDMCVALDAQQENYSRPIDRKLRNLLRVTESIQISPHGRFCSIKFTKIQIMSIFCTEPLTISENHYIVFKPDYKPPQTRDFIFISFLNVPFETEETKWHATWKKIVSYTKYTTQNNTLETLPTIPEREYIDAPT